MTLPVISNPFDTYIDLEGLTLNGGHVYIGIAGMDPQTNPQATYWDAASTIPATQPLDTLGGYITRANTPARAYTAPTFSMRVLDRSGDLVFYEPNCGPETTLDILTFLQAGTGAVSRTALSKMRERVSVADFGAVGNGSANDTVAIAAAIASGAKIINFGPGTFLSDGNITLGTGQTLIGQGSGATTLKLRTATAQPFIVAIDAPGCAIRAMTLDANNLITYNSVIAGIRCDDMAVEDTKLIGCERFGVAINSSNRVSVRRNRIYMPQLLSVRVASLTAGAGGAANQVGLLATVTGGAPTVAEVFLYDTTAGGAVTNVRYQTQGGIGKGYSVAAGVPTITFPAVPSASCVVALAGSKVIAINAPCSYSIGADWVIADNYLLGGGINISTINAKVHHNHVIAPVYGSGLVTEQQSGTSGNDFAFNTLEFGGADQISGLYIGPDTDNTMVTGMELWGVTDAMHDNVCRYNAGPGVSFGAANALCQNNQIYDNGKYTLQQGGPYTSAGLSSGIVLRGEDATWNAQGSILSGNRCYDSAGAAGGQSYGIGAVGANALNISITDNDCVSNRVANYNISLVLLRSWRGRRLVGSIAYDMASIAAGGQGSQGVTMSGLTASGWSLTAYHNAVSAAKLIVVPAYFAANSAVVYFSNLTASAIDIANGTLTVVADELPA